MLILSNICWVMTHFDETFISFHEVDRGENIEFR